MVNERAFNLSGYFLLGFVLIFFVGIQFFDTPFSFLSITGLATTTNNGILNVTVMAQNKVVTIHSPLNITYNFSRFEPYVIALNVTSEFVASEWRYSLYNVQDNSWVYQDISFAPNSSITAVRRQNLLRVEAREVDANWHWAQVYFYVHINDSAPIISDIDENIYVCETDSLLVFYNGTDEDGDQLTTSITNPNPFFVAFVSYDGNQTTFFRLVSGAITKAQAGGVGGVSRSYPRTITISDLVPLIDTADVNITAIEINNPPVINNELGAQTVWTRGENSTFYHQYNVYDLEDGNVTDGNLTFNISFGPIVNVFGIGATTGIMNFTPTSDLAGDIYDIEVCVSDTAMESSHQNFSICEDRGHSNESRTVCDTFSLTVTNQNRPPEIINYTPIVSNFTVSGTSPMSFFVEVRDPDGTIPDIDWYVDGLLVSHVENLTNHTFVYTFGCGISGLHNVTIVTTDGLLNDSVSWNVTVNYVECLADSPRGGGGGMGGVDYCIEDWHCEDWNVCQNAKRSYDFGLLAVEDYTHMKEICAQNGYDDERFCGFQIKSCFDINDCQNNVLGVESPVDRRICYFTENPSCFDGILNCHSGGCETLVDCGGPCKKCPTCSDGIQNQGEEGIDCGGPCPYECEIEIPFKTVTIILLILAGIAILVILFFGGRLLIINYRRKKDRFAMLRAQGVKK